MLTRGSSRRQRTAYPCRFVHMQKTRVPTMETPSMDTTAWMLSVTEVEGLAQQNQHRTRPGNGGIRAQCEGDAKAPCKGWTNLTSAPPAHVLGRPEDAVVKDRSDLHEDDNVGSVQFGADPHPLNVSGFRTVECGPDGGPVQYPQHNIRSTISAADHFECHTELFTGLRLTLNSILYDNGNVALSIFVDVYEAGLAELLGNSNNGRMPPREVTRRTTA